MNETSSTRFPNAFLWGAATSAHQVEGGNQDSDWADWEQQGRLKESSGLTCDHYRRFREDFDLARSLGHNAHRFSVEWARVEPENGRINEAVLLHYREVVEALRERGLEPVVTLNHFTLPRWVAREGGWTSPYFVRYFLKFATLISDHLAGSVRYWVTVNEPMVLLYMGYVKGIWPPGEHSFEKAWEMIKNVVRAHTETYHMLHARRRNAWVGMAEHLRVYDPYMSFMPTDWFTVWLRRFFFNGFLLKACTSGFPDFPGLRPSWLKEARDTFDYIGVNYYSRDFVQFRISPIYGAEKAGPFLKDVEERNSLGWEIYPEGLYRVLTDLKKYRRPVFILENGVATKQDERRIVFIRKHLKAVSRAIQDGVDVRGYFHWSLMDNFEWADGFDPRFGLVEVDYKTLKRHPRSSADYFARICRTGEIPDEK